MLLLPPISTHFPYTTLFRSNGWLVPGERTATGAAIIAGDPHRFIEDPGVYQQIRLSCPEYDVLGLPVQDRKSTRLNSSHRCSSHAVFSSKKNDSGTIGGNCR